MATTHGDTRTRTDARREPAARWYALNAPPGPEPILLRRLRRRGFRALMVVDAVTLLAAMVAINLARFGFDWPTYPVSHYAVGFVLATGIHLVVYYFGGLYEPEPRLGRRPWLPRVTALTIGAVLLDGLAALLTERYLMPRGNLVALAVVASLAVTANRWLSRTIRVRRAGRPRVLLVGTPDDVDLAREHLGEHHRAAQVVGQTTGTSGLLELTARTEATDVLLVSTGTVHSLYPEPLTAFEHQGIGVLQRVGAQETVLGLTGTVEIAGMPFVGLRAHALAPSRAHLKRLVELTALVAALPLLVPVILAVAAYVRVAAGPGVLFRQERVGRNGRVFDMVKFRTMRPDAEEGVGPILARRDDPRVIPACQWLRDTRLDELPQVWNVLKGEMSVVGPRPERPELTAEHERVIPGYARRHEIPPGITGLAQIRGSYHTDPSYKLGHDLQYLVNWSPILDLEILLRTIWVVVTRRV